MTSFSIVRNVIESYSISVPSEFVQDSSSVARFSAEASFIATPTLKRKLDMLNVVSVESEPSITSVTTGPSSVTISTTANDCYILQGLTATFSATDTKLGMGTYGVSLQGGTYYYGSYKSWIPFVLPLAQGTQIVSAMFTVISTITNSSAGSAYQIVGCENSSNASVPTSYADLNSRTMTANFVRDDVQPIWITGTEYSYDITSAVQEILDNALWVSSNTLAVLCLGGSGTRANLKEFASFENATYTEPKLIITY